MAWTNIRRNLKPTTRTLLSVKKQTNKSLSLGKTKSVYPNVGEKRNEHATALRSLKNKMGRKAYIEHRLKAAKSSVTMRKNSK